MVITLTGIRLPELLALSKRAVENINLKGGRNNNGYKK
jgi:hypothetical protein